LEKKPLLGISSCLLGEKVRYDGGHKLDRFLAETLGRHVEYYPVCPESECGLGVPREAMRLVELNGEIRLLTRNTGIDRTEQMLNWLRPKLEELARLPLTGFIFKSQSPSSGLYRVKVFRNGMPAKTGSGIFAQAFCEKFPLLPVEEDGRLKDPRLRENFIMRIFVRQRWLELLGKEKRVGLLVDFHARHKYLLMAHSQKTLKELGALVAGGERTPPEDLYDQYWPKFINALGKIATIRKNTNVLQHIMGYFKKKLDNDEKAELSEIIVRYHREQVPLLVPLTLLNHYVRKFGPPYLEKQFYLNPHPRELMLRNNL